MADRRGGGGGGHREAVQYFSMKDQLVEGCTALIVGKRCSGKSILLFDIMSHMSGWFNYGLALSPTQSSRKKFASCMPRSFIDHQSPERLEEFVTIVNAEFDKAMARGREPRSVYLLCDDVAYDDKFMRCKTLQEVFLNGRQFNCTCVMVAQYIMKCSPSLRGNSDYVFCFWDNNQRNQEKIWEYWFNMMPKPLFKEVFQECTRDYGVLVMDVRASATSRDWHDCVFWYKADPEAIEPFTLCDPDFFRLDDYCRVDPNDARNLDNSKQDRVWRLGPDNKPYDKPSGVPGIVDDDEEAEEEIIEWT